MACNLRLLLVAAIVLSNFISWTASKHHYKHNVSGHRSRHRRQGAAGLYMSAKFVIPGGDGEGWGEWGAISGCSRTCGGGVASQKRICLRVGTDGQPQCTGGNTKYFLCETQECPEGSIDFRAEQCSQFNNKDYRGMMYEWVPFTYLPNPCELNCMPRSGHFYYRHVDKVIDGTRCTDDPYDVCVNGQCEAVGCDMMLGSTVREDKCRDCGGNGTNCHTISGLLSSRHYSTGYNDLLLIPKGSTNIVIKEKDSSNNFLALRSKNGTYFLNGDYRIDFPKSIEMAGTLWHYERDQLGLASPDKLRCLGPTKEPLYLSVYIQEDNVGIEYEFSVPNSAAGPTHVRYHWAHDAFASCTLTCGGGYQTRNVTCRTSDEAELVADTLCDEDLKPSAVQSCNTQSCPARWVDGPWGTCSQPCGMGGIRSRNITCERVIANGFSSIVNERECLDSLGPKSALFDKCNEDTPCPKWFIGPWKRCDKLCDKGKQTRQVICHVKNNGRVNILPDKECGDTKPQEEKECTLGICKGADWVYTEWVGCDTCQSTQRTRRLLCVSNSTWQVVVDERFCSHHKKPIAQERCNQTILNTCGIMWYATQWGKCSVECGEGVMERQVFCGETKNNSVVKVEDSICDPETRYNDTKPCSIPLEKCPEKWYQGAWEECSKKCGKGRKHRKVSCFKGNEPYSNCSKSLILDVSENCNQDPCPPESLTTPTTSLVPTLEYCKDDEFPEVGADIADEGFIMASTSQSGGTYFGSDETSAEPGSSTTDSEIGSGFGSTLDDYLITTEGSGSSPSLEKVNQFNGTATDDVNWTNPNLTLDNAETSTGSTDNDTDISSSSASIEDTTGASTSVSESSPETTNTQESGSSVTTDPSASIEDTTGASTSVSESSPETTNTQESGSSVTTDPSVSIEDTTGASTSVSESSPETTNTQESGSAVTTDSSESIEDTTGTSPSLTDSSSETTTTQESESAVTTDSSASIEDATGTSTSVTDFSPETSDTQESESSTTTDSPESINDTTGTSSSVSESSTETTTTQESGSTVTTDSSASTDDTTGTSQSVTDSSPETTNTQESESAVTTDSSASTDDTTGTSPSVTDSSLETTNTQESESAVTTDSSASIEDASGTSPSVTDSSTETTNTQESAVTTDSSASTDDTTGTSPSVTDSSPETTNTQESAVTTDSSTSTEDATGTSPSVSESSPETTTTSGTESTVVSTESSSFSPESTTKESEGSEGSPAEGTTATGVISTTISEASSVTPDISETTTEHTEVPNTATESISEQSTTSTSAFTFLTTTNKQCIPRPKCDTTTFGCCPDNKTAAKGPFDLGCKIYKSCLETKYGCCPDGVSPSKGDDWEGCPSTPCAETLYGCCVSDNKTAAAGNDQEGCPDPASVCKFSNYGCCADNMTEATGPDKLGCPERATTVGLTTTLTSESTGGIESTSDITTVTSNVSETGTSDVTETGTSTETSSANETTTSGVTETGTSTETSSVSETTTSGVTETGTSTEISSISETTISGVTETGTSSETSSFSETGTSGVTETGTSTVSENATTTVTAQLTTVRDDCSVSEFGCCYDNVTAATDVNGLSCPCNATEFGCCSDGQSPAEGPDQQGCQGDCNNTQYGCCDDGQTPAHGPHSEGCCLLTAFRCCRDNRTPAKGPHFEGCECQSYLYGCCPDQVTAAAGPDNKGCGCQYTLHGCCPDRHTEATGPNNEGCPCSTFQYGCCDDGVTTAAGPEQQGCHCSFSPYGCCGDNETPANSPNASDCSCAVSKFGCCPDGTTKATGPMFLGCTDAPENKQAACSLSKDVGSCHDYKVFWFYDLTYGGCTQFWYSGCEGNGNRFATKEDCEEVCVHPPPKDACKLPEVKGPCEGDNVRWHYDSAREQCTPFRYGGCLGNDNNFESRELCQAHCGTDTTTDQCSLPIEEGSCAGTYSRWGYSQERGQCVQFAWGGCEGNANRFRSEAACQRRCSAPGAAAPRCTEDLVAGNCTEKMAMWSFSPSEDRCVPFYYSGCDGNDNRFDSQTSCKQTCPSAYEPDKCTLPYDIGECSDFGGSRWFYDTKYHRCREFPYGGCGGNGNNFATRAECDNTCSEDKFIPIPTTVPPVTRSTPSTTTTTQREDICHQPMVTGPCQGSVMMWFYNSATDTCSQFTYGGCEGNDNKFESREACERRCRAGSAQTTTVAVKVASRIGELAECKISTTLEACSTPGVVWFYHPDTYECIQHENRETGDQCRTTGVFLSQEACRRSCGDFKGLDRCSLPMDTGPCNSIEMTVYYDQEAGYCKYFEYGGCDGNANRFSTMHECSEVCMRDSYDEMNLTTVTSTTKFTTTVTTAAPPILSLPSECVTPSSLERCGEGEVVFYYDSERRMCVESDIGGCGHANSYSSEEACERSCIYRGINVCEARMSAGPCQNPIQKYYWDRPSGSCLPFTYGGCEGGPNRFSSAGECEEVCGNSGPASVCLVQVDPGSSCEQHSSARWYYNPSRAECVAFAYQGCGGNGNNFDSYDECAYICHVAQPTVPPRRNCTPYEDECRRLRCEYSVDYSYTNDGCLTCACASPPDCEPARLSCERLSCPYGVKRETASDGCESCQCYEDPCTSARCSEAERCQVEPSRDPATQEPRYSARCVPVREEDVPRPPKPDPRHETNVVVSEGGSATLRCLFHGNPPPSITWRRGEITIEGNVGRYRLHSDGALEIVSLRRTDSGVYICIADNGLGVATQEINLEVRGPTIDDCEEYTEECKRLKCEYNVQRKRLPNGCTNCTCVTPEIDCPPFEKECEQQNCYFGIEKYKDGNGCLSCRCAAHPCMNTVCATGERCAVVKYRDAVTMENRTTTECRRVNKPGMCPVEKAEPNEECISQCSDDAGCRGIGKCCRRGCSRVCLIPVRANAAPSAPPTTTHAPELPRVPVPDPRQEKNVIMSEGGKATLRCLFHSNPPPTITWRRGELTIEGNLDRYRLLSDGTLEIVSLRRTDSGVYICVADNGIGSATRKVQLMVSVPVSAHIKPPSARLGAGEQLSLTCEIDGFPEPEVVWSKNNVRLSPDDKTSITSNGTVSQLTVARLAMSDGGLYACHARNEYSSDTATTQITVKQEVVVPAKCTDSPYFANCPLIVRSNYCRHNYYGKFCCKSCVEAGQLAPEDAMQADAPGYRRK